MTLAASRSGFDDRRDVGAAGAGAGASASAAAAGAMVGTGAARPAFADWMAERGARTERALDALLPPADSHPARLHEAMRYAVLGGGKRVRPLLVHAAGEALGAPAAALDRAACAVELIHTYSLVHDDLPCMDDDVLRRGRPTTHVVYGEALAMLVGDALQPLAFEAVLGAAAHGVPPAAVLAMAAELAHAAGSVGMAGGQAIDLQAVGGGLGLEALEDMHQRKTGAMLRASVRLGAGCAGLVGGAADAAPGAPGADPRWQALDRYADAIGLAFQVVDDILDVEGDAASLGKTAGKDAAQNKPTYVSLMGLEPARQFAARLREQAWAALLPLGPAARRLGELADLIVLRKS